MQLLDTLLDSSHKRETFDTMALWFESFNRQTRQFDLPIERAILGGRLSQNVGFTFTAGYQSAIEALFAPEFMGEPKLSSLCVTESAGNHPRAIEAELTEDNGRYFLSGNKAFVSGAKDAQLMFIACKTCEDEQGRPKLKVVSVATDSTGVDIHALPELSFIPEVSHGSVRLDRVEVSKSQILRGDGYSDYVKPFRSYEDVHVFAAIVGYRLGEAISSNWGQESIQLHLPLILSLQAIATMDLTQPGTHIALAACRVQLAELIENTDAIFEANNLQAYECWCRDRALLKVAGKANKIRTEKAWLNLRR